jgi:uncharacterized protein (TIGR02147 family)
METSLDYRHLLREELVARCGRNPVYSARAMARDLQVSPAFFSQIMSGTRALSEERAVTLAEKIRWSAQKRRVFVKLVRLQATNDERLRGEIRRDIKRTMGRKKISLASRYHDLSHDEFKVIADWYHFAIVELADICELKDDSAAVASRFGLSNVVAMQAIERLIRIGLLKREAGLLTKVRESYRMGAVPSAAIRGFHKDHLKKAALAIEEQSVETRDFSGTTFAINPKKLPRAKALIRRFQSDLMELLETGDRSAVYHLAVQLYRLDQESST